MTHQFQTTALVSSSVLISTPSPSIQSGERKLSERKIEVCVCLYVYVFTVCYMYRIHRLIPTAYLPPPVNPIYYDFRYFLLVSRKIPFHYTLGFLGLGYINWKREDKVENALLLAFLFTVYCNFALSCSRNCGGNSCPFFWDFCLWGEYVKLFHARKELSFMFR